MYLLIATNLGLLRLLNKHVALSSNYHPTHLYKVPSFAFSGMSQGL